MRGQQRSFSTHERVFLWKCQSFWYRKCLDMRGLEPQTFGFMPNALTYWVIRARNLLSHVFEHWLWRYRYFCSKVNIWYVNCARATAFIFDTTNYIHYTDEITFPFPNFNGCTFEVWEWIQNFDPHFTGHVITYPCKLIHISKRGSW